MRKIDFERDSGELFQGGSSPAGDVMSGDTIVISAEDEVVTTKRTEEYTVQDVRAAMHAAAYTLGPDASNDELLAEAMATILREHHNMRMIMRAAIEDPEAMAIFAHNKKEIMRLLTESAKKVQELKVLEK
jgi:hypothetical protein